MRVFLTLTEGAVRVMPFRGPLKPFVSERLLRENAAGEGQTLAVWLEKHSVTEVSASSLVDFCEEVGVCRDALNLFQAAAGLT